MDVRTIVRFAVFTRVLSLVLQAVLNALIPDHVAEAFSPPRAEEPLLLDYSVEVLFSGLSRWDAEHFLFIAERGYVYEHNHAFFPLFPLVLRTVAAIVLWPLGLCLTRHGCLLLAVAITNSVLFVLSAVALYKLSRVVFQDRKLALIASLMFCITPANVFMLAGYSESLFAVLTFGGLLMLERGFTLRSGFLLGLACATRSNGLLNTGFPLYIHLQQILNQTHDKVNHVLATLKFLLTSLFYIVIIALPFVLFQCYGYSTFCLPSVTPEQVSPALLKLATVKGYNVPDALAPTPSWCSSTIPLLYSYIQDVYWNVGFLRYFQLRQIPNFLLALPVTVLSFLAVSMYIMRNPYLCLRLGLYDTKKKEQKEGKPEQGFYSKTVFVYVVHCSILLIFGVFCMHVQVLTRFLASSSPLLYWISAHILLSYEPLLQQDECLTQRPTQQQESDHLFLTFINNPVFQLLVKWKSCCFYTRCILGYFLSYWLLGLALHCNFLPWT